MSNRSIVALLFFITAWAFSEIFVRNAVLAYEHHSAILTGIAGGIVLATYLYFKEHKRLPLILTGLVLSVLLLKWLVVPLGGVHYSCIVNSSLAIFLDGLFFAAALLLLRPRSFVATVAIMAAASLPVALTFRVVGISLYPCNYLLSFSGADGVFRFVGTEGGTWVPAVMFFTAVVWWLKNIFSYKLQVSWMAVITGLLLFADIAGAVIGWY